MSTEERSAEREPSQSSDVTEEPSDAGGASPGGAAESGEEPRAEASPNGGGEPGNGGEGSRSSGEGEDAGGGPRTGGRLWSETFSDVQDMVGDILEGVREIPTAIGRFPRYDLVRVGEEGYRILLDLPGVTREDVQVKTVGDELVISGRRDRPELPESAEVMRSERGFGRFRRTLRMPADVRPEDVSASLEDGVLEIRLPRRTPAEARTVDIG